MQKREFLYRVPNPTANLNEMRLKDMYCDVTIKVDGKEIRAHKVILAANLKYFETMFSSDCFNESRGGDITMKSVEKADLELIVSYAYTGEILLTDSNAMNLLELANYLTEDGIKEACLEFLVKHLRAEDAWRAYTYASAIDCPSLKNAAKEKIITNFEGCSNSADYLDIDFKMLMLILSDKRIRSIKSQRMFFEGILKWITHDVKERKICLEDLLGSIKIIRLKSDDFLNCLYENVAHYDDDNGITQETITFYKVKKSKRKGGVLMTVDFDTTYQFYNLTEKKWTPMQRFPYSNECTRIYWSGAVLHDKFYYICKNSGKSHLQVFDPWSRKVTRVYPANNHLLGYATLCACNSFLYICGGMKANAASSDQLFRYNPWTNTFDTLATMTKERHGAAAIFSAGYLYVMGGSDDISFLQSAEKYDPVKNEWTDIAPMCEQRWGHAVAELNGRLYACGGYSGADLKSSVEMYNPTTNRWRMVASMNRARSYFLVVSYDGKLYAIGGGEEEKTVEAYDPNTNKWQVGKMSSGLHLACRAGGLFSPNCFDPCEPR